MKIRFIFHKALGERGIGKVIVAWTWVLGCFYNWKVLKYNYSHEEAWIPSEVFGDFSYIPHEKHIACYAGQCFSSTTRGNPNGVRLAPAHKILKHPERWDYIEVEVDPERLEVALEESKKLVGKEYDYWGIFGFIQPIIVQDPEKWFCSEICEWFKVLVGIKIKKDRRISPRRSAYLLAKSWGEPKSILE